MNIRIQKAKIDNIPSILRLVEEFADVEGLTEFFEVTEEKLIEVMFGENRFVTGLIAFDDERPISYALYYPAFLSFRGQRSVYLEDIFVTEEYRKYGVGEKMVKEVACRGREFGAVRMDFQVLEWNQPAIDFYRKHGAVIDDDERHFKFTDEAFKNLLV